LHKTYHRLERRRLDPATHLPIRPDGQFVLKDQLQELCMVESVAGGLLQADVERLRQARQPQLLLSDLQRFLYHQDSSKKT
jgi:hypothetical protein